MAGLPRELGEGICRALGLDPKDVKRVAFDWSDRSEPVVEVTMYVSKEHGAAIGEVLKRYELVERSTLPAPLVFDKPLQKKIYSGELWRPEYPIIVLSQTTIAEVDKPIATLLTFRKSADKGHQYFWDGLGRTYEAIDVSTPDSPSFLPGPEVPTPW